MWGEQKHWLMSYWSIHGTNIIIRPPLHFVCVCARVCKEEMLYAGLSKDGPGLSVAGGIKADGPCLVPDVIRMVGGEPLAVH